MTAGGFESAIARFGTGFARSLAEHHLWLVDLIALGGLVFEIGAPLLLVSGTPRKVYAGAAIVFHLSTSILTGLHFFGWIVVCLGAFALERVPAALSARARGVTGPGSREPGPPRRTGHRDGRRRGAGPADRRTGVTSRLPLPRSIEW